TSYALSVTAGPSNLIDTATGQTVVLSMNGNVVEGHAGAGGPLVFTASVDANGKVSFDLDRAVHEDNASNTPDDATSLTANLIQLTATVTDGDGDKASQSLNIGNTLSIKDDGPAISLSGATAQTLEVDESYLANGSTPNAVLTAATAAFAGMFTVVQGADGATTSYGVSVSSQGVTSNLIDSATGQTVVLTQSGGTVSGYVTGHSGDAAYLVFTLAVNAASGQATLTDFRAVHQNTADNPTDTSEGISLTSGLVTLTATVTDGDGDTASKSIDLGSKAVFHDDGPSLSSFTSGVIPNEVGSVAGFFSLIPGADGIEHFNITGPVISGVSYATTVALDGTTTLHGQTSGGIDVFSVTVAPNGTYHFDLFAPQLATSNPYDLTALPSGGPAWRQTTDGRVEFSSPDGINSSGAGFGVANQWTGSGEAFTMEFHNPGQPGDQSPNVNPEFNDAVTINVAQINGSGGTYNWTAVDTVHNVTESGSVVITAAGAVLIDPTISFNQLTFEGGNDVSGQGIRITSMTVSKTILPSDQSYDFHVTATDRDGDTTGASTLHIDQVAAGSGGSYALNGTAGNDVIAGSTHTDTISGGAGTDIADYTGSLAAISINLHDDGHANAAAFSTNPADGTIGGGDAAGDTLTGIEGLIGGSGDDYLFGNSGANYLAGGLGNDTLRGEGGADTLIGGGGNDMLIGGGGANTMTGGAGDDTFVIDPSKLTLHVADVIADYTQGHDVIDLSDLLQSLGGNAPTTDPQADATVSVTFSNNAAHVMVDDNGTAAGGSMVEVATLTGVGVNSAITILYDHTHTHTETVP
ncbi:DUF5801 repeats-in-toxin domain-containing protein, partial [Mesorhizobium sp. WSM3224]|uniref:DUF5801 repeats-in-toxin domain-containing protein n=1 Tax=Mesorhizobium sp. WSM3224 TaxID=1040986 RepID=UPI000485667E